MSVRVELTVVRHGETDDNLARVISGQSDVHLNATGVQQATSAGRHLADDCFDLVISSDLVRAVETANAILDQNNHVQVQTQNLKRAKGDEKWEEDKSKTTKVETSDLLRERAFGCLQGQPFSQLKAIAKAEGKRSWTQLVPEGGESDAQIQQRCDKFLKGLFQRLSQDESLENVLLVSHGGFIRHLAVHLAGTKKIPDFSIREAAIGGCSPNAGISQFSLELSKSDGKLLSGERRLYYFRPY